MSGGVHLAVQIGTKWGPEAHLNHVRRPKGVLRPCGAVWKASGRPLDGSGHSGGKFPLFSCRFSMILLFQEGLRAWNFNYYCDFIDKVSSQDQAR